MTHETTTTISIRKAKLPAEQRMAAKALLLSLDPNMLLQGGQLILHFGPGRNPFFVEFQERHERSSQRLQKVG